MTLTKFAPRCAAHALSASVALSFGASALVMAAPAAAQTSSALDAAFETFVPGTNPNTNKIDYSIWDEAMRNLVLSMGPSMRDTAGPPARILNTRRQFGPVSRYRLEGSLMTFAFLNTDVISSFGEYRRDLEATATKVDIQALSRNEQLAYWINLHNVALVEKLSENWPLRQPRSLEINDVPLDDAKFITVEGVSLSLRDIRENIVYKNWKNPKVIYGFWRGEIGGPALQRSAFNADNVSQLLDRSAREFVNSLRGTQKFGSKLMVSTLYAETAEFFFPDLESDVRAHIAQYANADVQDILANTSKFDASIREYDIADISGGAREMQIYNNSGSGRVPPAMAQLLAQRERKFELMIRRGVRTGTVTFSNITLPGDDDDDGQVE